MPFKTLLRKWKGNTDWEIQILHIYIWQIYPKLWEDLYSIKSGQFNLKMGKEDTWMDNKYMRR